MPIDLRFNLFKPSGKWAYGGTVTISGENRIWETDKLLAEIDANQTVVVKGTITGRHYIFVIEETPEQAAQADYHGFYTHLYSNLR